MYIAEYIANNSPWQLLNWLGNHLWSGAKDRWDSATQDKRIAVAELILDIYEDDAFVDQTEINDFVWFECDFIFYPEDEGPADFTDLKFEGVD